MLRTVGRIGVFFQNKVHRSATTNVHHITDTEGHYQSFIDSIASSNIVAFNRHDQLAFKPGGSDPYFVFGGDLTDRGAGDTALTEKLLNFKLRYPDKVILLAGNREASKNRFHIELNPKYIRERLLNGGVPRWLLSRPHKTPCDYVKSHMETNNKTSDKRTDIEAYVNLLSIETCQIIYLKWMLEQSMGCPHTFSYHAQQLANKFKRSIHDISEVAVLESILEQTSPNGLIGEYLKQTQIGVIIPNTGILVVHGGLTPDNIGRIPTMQPTDPIINDARSWINQFNIWYKLEVLKWAGSQPAHLPLQLQPASSPLEGFTIRTPPEYKSIVTSSMLDEQRQFVAVPNSVSDYLQHNGIYLVLTGHQPCGDHPAILRSEGDRVLFINGDNSYANAQANNPYDTRGGASHALQITGSAHNARININAKLRDNSHVQTCLDIINGQFSGDDHIGTLLPGNELVQYQLSNGNYRTIYQKGFTVRYTTRSSAEIEEILKLQVKQVPESIL